MCCIIPVILPKRMRLAAVINKYVDCGYLFHYTKTYDRWQFFREDFPTLLPLLFLSVKTVSYVAITVIT